MSTSAPVALAKAATYDPAEILAAVRGCLDHLGGIRAWVKPGQRVLLKPNLLGGFPVERAVTTHPAVIRAVALLVREAGGEPWIGDSPGMGALDKVASRCGLEPVLAETGARLVDFSEAAEYPVPGHRVVPQLTLTRVLREVDVIISLPKLKTHGHLVMTGALKNQYGLIPGSLKSQWHFRLRQPEWMAALILDIDRVARPALAIMDAVVAMEGAGPSAGQPRPVGALLAGACLVSVDVVACQLIGLQPPQVPVLAAAASQQYGTTDPRKIEVLGGDWRSLRVPDFAPVPHLADVQRLVPPAGFCAAVDPAPLDGPPPDPAPLHPMRHLRGRLSGQAHRHSSGPDRGRPPGGGPPLHLLLLLPRILPAARHRAAPVLARAADFPGPPGRPGHPLAQLEPDQNLPLPAAFLLALALDATILLAMGAGMV